MNILEKAVELVKARIPFVLATVVEAKGSTPRSAAAKMLILADGTSFDTVGGGLVEARVLREAAEALAERKPRLVKYRLDSDDEGGLNMLCGGDMDIFIDVYTPVPHIIIVGGGHVGLEISKIAVLLGWEYSVIEARRDYNSRERFPQAREIYHEGDLAAVTSIESDENTYIMIVTGDHDKEILRQAVIKPAGYIAMLGSRRKAARIFAELAAEGIPEEKLMSVHTPAGLEIGAETPAEIAVSVAAEMIKQRRQVDY